MIANQPRRRSLARREAVAGYLFIAPAVLGFLCWTAGPMIASVWLATTDWDLIRAPRPVGLANVGRLLDDELFWASLVATAYYTAVHVPLALGLALAIALLLNTSVRGIGFYRTVYYLPSIVPAVANAVLWVWIFNSEFGLLNLGLQAIGLPKVAWLQDASWAMPALIVMSLWSLGATMVIYLAGLQGVPQHLYEAAAIDGAGALARFRHVTVPMLSPIIFFNLVLQIIGSFQVFTAGYIMTRGGPEHATLFYVLYLFQNAFQYFKMGYASALAWVLFFIVLGFSLLLFRYVGRLVHYEEVR